MRRNRFLVSCMALCLSVGTASAQAVDGVSGASTRVLAPADSLRIDSTNKEVPNPSRPIESPTTIDSTVMQTTKKQARKHLVTVQAEVPEPSPKKGRLTIGGYGEAAMKRCFYSNNYLRYTSPENYVNDQYGEFDIPHVVVYLGYDFGKGWSMGSEIEFEHGGTEVAVEIEEEEA